MSEYMDWATMTVTFGDRTLALETEDVSFNEQPALVRSIGTAAQQLDMATDLLMGALRELERKAEQGIESVVKGQALFAFSTSYAEKVVEYEARRTALAEQLRMLFALLDAE